MHPIVAEQIARDHARRMEEYALAGRVRAATRQTRPRRDHPVRGRFADALVSLATRLDPPSGAPHRHGTPHRPAITR